MPQNTSLNPRPNSHINSAYLKLFKKIEINLKSKTIHSTVYLKLQVFYFYSTFWQIWGDICVLYIIQYAYALYKIRYNNLCIWFSTWKGWRVNQSHSKIDPRSKFLAGLADRTNSWALPNWSSCFPYSLALTGAHQHGIAIGQWPEKTCV